MVVLIFSLNSCDNEKDKFIGYWYSDELEENSYFKIEKSEDNYKLVSPNNESYIKFQDSDELKMKFDNDGIQVIAVYNEENDSIVMSSNSEEFECKRISEDEYKDYEKEVEQEKIEQEKIKQEEIKQENLKNNIELDNRISSGEVAVDDKYLYYGDGGALYKENKKTEEKKLLTDTRLTEVHQVYLYKNKLYFTDYYTEELRIYEYDLETSKNQMIFEIPEEEYSTRGIFYTKINDGNMYFITYKGTLDNSIPFLNEINLETKKHSTLIEIQNQKIKHVFVLNDLIYKDEKIYYSYKGLIDLFTTESFIVEFDIAKKSEEILYSSTDIIFHHFAKKTDTEEIYFYSGYGSTLRKWIPEEGVKDIIEDSSENHVFYKDKLIYKNLDDHDRYYKINLDGSENECLKDEYPDIENYNNFIVYNESIYGVDNSEKYVKLDDYFK
jgi:hypothetical protein